MLFLIWVDLCAVFIKYTGPFSLYDCKIMAEEYVGVNCLICYRGYSFGYLDVDSRKILK
jgi:hypothetical protein